MHDTDDRDRRTDDRQTPTPSLPDEPLGDVTARLDVDAETYDRLRAAYERAVATGYTETLAHFAYNYCRVDHVVTVDGEPAPEWCDGFETAAASAEGGDE